MHKCIAILNKLRKTTNVFYRTVWDCVTVFCTSTVMSDFRALELRQR